MTHNPRRQFLWAIAALGAVAGLIAFTGCNRSDKGNDTASGTPALVQPGTRISFGEGGKSEVYRVSGWSKTEPKFTWTEGTTARVRLPISATNDALALKMTMAALIKPPEMPFQPVEVYVNGQKIAEWQVGTTAEFVASIPASLTKPGGNLEIEFKTPKATSPKALGLSPDPRVLGICCLDLELAKA